MDNLTVERLGMCSRKYIIHSLCVLALEVRILHVFHLRHLVLTSEYWSSTSL